VLPPSFNVYYEQMDYDIISPLFVVEFLQHEARVAMPEMRSAPIRPAEFKS